LKSPPTLLQNSSALLGASIATRVIGYATTITIARMLGGEQFGRLAFATVAVGYFGILVEFGTSNWLVREVARRKPQAEGVARASARLRLTVFALGLPAVAILALTINKTPDVKLAMGLVAASLLPKTVTGIYIALMQGHERMELVAGLSVAEVTASLVLCVTALLISPSIVTLTAAGLVSAVVELVIARFLCRRAGCPVGLGGKAALWRTAAVGGAPFLATAILGAAYFKADILLLSFLRGDLQVGYYSAASRLIESARFIPWALSFPLYPVLSKGFAEGRPEIHELQARAAGLLLAVGLPIAALSSVFSREIIVLLYGAGFAPAAAALKWLAWALPLIYVNILFCFSAYAQDRQRQVMWLMTAMFAFNVGFNAWAIPAYGITGAAVSTVLTEVLALVFYVTVLLWKPKALPRFSRTAIKAGLACGAAGGLRPVSDVIGPVPAAALVLALYCVLVIRLGAVSLGEVKALSVMAGLLAGRGVNLNE
jgi:O-antigen/teichoic acid export membrane protein